jgi:HK97 family phage major capsid protein/HK97 family phage prohead protease
MKLPPLTRAIEVRAESVKDRTIELSFSSENPVDRWFGSEILSHDKGAADLRRLNDGAPVLFNHNMNDLRGVVEKAWIGDDRRGHAIVRLSKNADGQKALDLINEGVLRNVSFMYRVNEIAQTKEEADANRYRVVDWEALELSLVTVPADQSVGIGRASDREELEVRTHSSEQSSVSTQAKTAEGNLMENQTAPSAGASAAVPATVRTAVIDQVRDGMAPPSALDAENARQQAIRNLCKGNKLDSRVEMRWINEGATLEQVSRELLDVLEARQTAKPSGEAVLGLSAGDLRRYSLVRAIRALKFPNQSNLQAAGYELECSNAVAKQMNRGDINSSLLIPTDVLRRPIDPDAFNMRAMATQPGSKGGYLVGVENMGFIEILRARSCAMRMGARQLSGLVGNVIFPRQTGKSSVTWQGGDGTSITASDQALGQLSMVPRTAIIVTDVSEQLLRQSSPSAEAFITADLAATIAIDGVDNAAIKGTGGAQPIGIINTSGITSGQDAASATYAKILAFPQTAGSANAIRGNPGWITTTAGASRLMQVQRFTSTDTPLWMGNLLDGSCVGFPAMSTEQVSSGGLIFGSWDELVIGDWGVLELSTDNGGTRFNQAQVGIRALWMVDVMLRYPQAFIVSSNLS